ncbi:UvrD-helicase domain-containing protein [Flavobacterium sp. LB3P21]|uniref:UvrD-helicase domain-containing protein n=1 Tax=Flavobacterium sp. LB3P21 TaxID=3401719 RepID=UPI003AAA7FE4
MENNKLIIAAAGSGKTTYLIDEAIKNREKKVLITTYTQANEAEIKKKIIEKINYIPENITIQTWFSFLLKHGVRPYQGIIFDKRINGLILVNNKSALYVRKTETEKYYFTKDIKIYSDKISEFVCAVNEKTNSAVINRISKVYSKIFIDEIQDLAGYDLELLKLLFSSKSEILLVGDPRQGTYSTNSSSKNKQFKKANVVNYFFQDKSINIETDETSLLVNYRCNEPICNLSNNLFKNFVGTKSGNDTVSGHDGIFFIKEKDVEDYLKKFNPVQLRDSKKKNVNENFIVMNFGESKGLSFDRVLIYPTKPFVDWFMNNESLLAETSRSKLYVAITRARYSVGIVVSDKGNLVVDGITNYMF